MDRVGLWPSSTYDNVVDTVGALLTDGRRPDTATAAAGSDVLLDRFSKFKSAQPEFITMYTLPITCIQF